MDNRHVDITSEGNDDLDLALRIIWSNAPGGKATHYTFINSDGTNTMVLLWNEEKGAIALPFPLDLGGAINFVINWLKNVQYGPQPDHDGSNGKGWRVYNERWGHVAGYRCAIVGITPRWAMYGE